MRLDWKEKYSCKISYGHLKGTDRDRGTQHTAFGIRYSEGDTVAEADAAALSWRAPIAPPYEPFLGLRRPEERFLLGYSLA